MDHNGESMDYTFGGAYQGHVGIGLDNNGGGRDAMGMGMGMGTDNIDGMQQQQQMVGGSSLDELVSQNTQELNRRRSIVSQFALPDDERRIRDARRSNSMVDFGSMANTNGMDGDFTFDPGMWRDDPHGSPPDSAGAQTTFGRHGLGDLSINSQYANMAGMGSMSSTQAPFQSPISATEPLHFGSMNYPTSTGVGMGGGMMYSYPSNSMDQVTRDVNQFNFSPTTQNQSLETPMQSAGMHGQGALRQSFSTGIGGAVDMNTELDNMAGGVMLDDASEDTVYAPISIPQQMHGISANSNIRSGSLRSTSSATPMSADSSGQRSNESLTDSGISAVSANGKPEGLAGRNPTPALQTETSISSSGPAPIRSNLYSQSGFDMLQILSLVANRPNPTIDIGAVDLSCAFVVCDVEAYDIPIVYCSEVFEQMTGYSKHETLGRNCRFLQDPTGQVQAGEKRRFSDDRKVHYLKEACKKFEEAQTDIVNYRKGGAPFVNMLTMIPIKYRSNKIKYIVGFQVDMVERPSALRSQNPGTLQA
jgi:PAS domain-containing protein